MIIKINKIKRTGSYMHISEPMTEEEPPKRLKKLKYPQSPRIKSKGNSEELTGGKNLKRGNLLLRNPYIQNRRK